MPQKAYLFIIASIIFFSCGEKIASSKKDDTSIKENYSTSVEIPMAGNSFITKLATGSTEKITDNGLENWTNKESITTAYFKVTQKGKLQISIKAKVADAASSVIKIIVNDDLFTLKLNGSDYKNYFVGNVNINKTGYVKIIFKGESKTGKYIADISHVIVESNLDKSKLFFANDSANYYWSLRGPSCHLNYITPTADKEYFYSELTVPAGQDKIGSYFMANGFTQGYFGIQVNSETERRVLFSVWEPDENNKTILVKKGIDVTDGRFDGEGTGGQSYLKYDWKADVTYKFLTRAKPDGNGATVFTSWFYAPESNAWKLIASWKRQKLQTYLTSLYGFVENFIPENGYLGRKALYGNQWVCDTNGKWIEINECKFSVDATGKNKQRMDFAGGVENGNFYLGNGGFFGEDINAGTLFKRVTKIAPPIIDFDSLP
jgi:Domain of unknown function (DUF3472)/Domain of unknown function (DUF5077)